MLTQECLDHPEEMDDNEARRGNIQDMKLLAKVTTKRTRMKRIEMTRPGHTPHPPHHLLWHLCLTKGHLDIKIDFHHSMPHTTHPSSPTAGTGSEVVNCVDFSGLDDQTCAVRVIDPHVVAWRIWKSSCFKQHCDLTWQQDSLVDTLNSGSSTTDFSLTLPGQRPLRMRPRPH